MLEKIRLFKKCQCASIIKKEENMIFYGNLSNTNELNENVRVSMIFLGDFSRVFLIPGINFIIFSIYRKLVPRGYASKTSSQREREKKVNATSNLISAFWQKHWNLRDPGRSWIFSGTTQQNDGKYFDDAAWWIHEYHQKRMGETW